MARYKLILEYDGGAFVGWQRQDNGASVQAALEEAVKGFCGESVIAHAAGRTDAGVHALAMCAHIDLESAPSADTVRDAVNHFLLPVRISVISAEEVGEDFHARFSCVRRAYEYRIINRRSPLALDFGRAWRVRSPLDADAMHAAAQCLVGKHDFTTFRAAACQAETPVKTLEQISVSRVGDDVVIRTTARSFLHHQVRSMAGSLVEVGKGKWSARDLKDALDAKDRTRCGQVAPSEGLFFVRADY